MECGIAWLWKGTKGCNRSVSPGHSRDNSPVQEQVRSKQELAWVFHGAPDEADHQDLQPGTLEEVDLIVEI